MGLSQVGVHHDQASRHTSPARVGVRLAATIALLVLIVDSNFMAGPPLVHWIPLAMFGVLGVLGWLVVARDAARLEVEFLVAAVAPLAAATLTAAASAYPSLSWSAAFDLALMSGTGLLICYAISLQGTRDILSVLGVMLVILVTFYLVQVALAYRSWLGLGFAPVTVPLRPLDAGGLASIPTWMSDYVVVVGPAIVVAFARTGRLGRWAARLLALACVAAILVAATRSIWLLLAIAAAAIAAAWLWRRPTARLIMALGGLMGMVGVTVFMVAFGPRITRDLDEGRLSAFGSAVAQFLGSPWIGTGPGTYAEYRLSYPVHVLEHLAFPNSHNIVLSTLADEGLLGLLALGLAAACWLVLWHRRWRERDRDTVMLVAAAVGNALLLGHAMVDVVVDVPGIAVCLMAVGGIALTSHAPKNGGPRPEVGSHSTARDIRRGGVSRGLALAGVLLLVVTGLAALQPELSLVSQSEADDAMSSAPSAALSAALEAAELTPDSAPAWNAVAVASDRAGRLDESISAVEHMVALEPLAQHRVELAILLARTGKPSGAIEQMRVAVQDQRDPFVQLNAAVLFTARDMTVDAVDAATQLVVLQPLVGLQRAALPPLLQSQWPSVTARAVADLQAAGRWDDALTAALIVGGGLVSGVISSAPPALRSTQSAVEAAWHGSEASLASIERSAEAHPSDVSLLRWSWLLTGHACQTARSASWAEAYAIEAGTPLQVPVNLGGGSPEVSMRPSRYPSAIWGYALPRQPYVEGTWTYAMGAYVCQ